MVMERFHLTISEYICQTLFLNLLFKLGECYVIYRPKTSAWDIIRVINLKIFQLICLIHSSNILQQQTLIWVFCCYPLIWEQHGQRLLWFLKSLQSLNQHHIKKIAVLCNVAPCSLVEVHWCFRGMYCLHHQDQRVSQASLLPTAYMLGFLFYHEDGDSTFLWNTSKLLQDYMA
jgi:hypothetical protein